MLFRSSADALAASACALGGIEEVIGLDVDVDVVDAESGALSVGLDAHSQAIVEYVSRIEFVRVRYGSVAG